MSERIPGTTNHEMKSTLDTKLQSTRNPGDASAERELSDAELSAISGGGPVQGGYSKPE